MLAFIFLVVALVALIIFFAILTVKKKNPEFEPPKVNTNPDLNKLDNLVSSVKKPKQETTVKQVDEPENNQQLEQPEEEPNNKQEQKEETTQKTTSKPGNRGKPPRKPPTLDLKQAMKSKQFLDRKD